MTKYEVVIPWVGVEKGDIIEFAELPRAVRANVRKFEANIELKVDDKIKIALDEANDKIVTLESDIKQKDSLIDSLTKDVNDKVTVIKDLNKQLADLTKAAK